MTFSKTFFWVRGITLGFLVAVTGCSKSSGGQPSPDSPAPHDENANPTNPPSPPAEDPPKTEQPKYGLTVQPTIESIQKDLIDVYCVRCHSGSTPPAKLNLTDLSRFLPPHDQDHDPNGYHGRLCVPGKPLDSMLFLVMKSHNLKDQMPPASSGIPAITSEQLKSVEIWLSSLKGSDDGGSVDEPGGDDGGSDGEPGGDDGGSDGEPGGDDGGSDGEPGGDEPGN